MRVEKYEDYKKRIGKKCRKCDDLLCPNNSSGLCKSCSMREIVKKRLGNTFKHTKAGIKYMEKLKQGYHKFEDLELIDLWERGWSDSDIAKALHVSTSSICDRRYKLRLVANFKPFVGENLNEDQMEERYEERLEEIEELKNRREDNPHYYEVKKYKNSLKNHGRDLINKKSRRDYKMRKIHSPLKCEECNSKLAPKNKSGLCISCSQKSFTNKEFFDLYKKGLNDYKIAEILGVHPPAVCRRRIKLKLVPYYSIKFTNADLTLLHNQGLNDCEIAKTLGVTSSSVRQRRIDLNLPNNFIIKRGGA